MCSFFPTVGNYIRTPWEAEELIPKSIVFPSEGRVWNPTEAATPHFKETLKLPPSNHRRIFCHAGLSILPEKVIVIHKISHIVLGSFKILYSTLSLYYFFSYGFKVYMHLKEPLSFATNLFLPVIHSATLTLFADGIIFHATLHKYTTSITFSQGYFPLNHTRANWLFFFKAKKQTTYKFSCKALM